MDELRAAITQSLSDPLVADKLRQHPDLAATLSQSLEKAIRQQCGGQRFYVARMRSRADSAQQRLQAQQQFNGHNYSELAQQLGVQERSVRRMIHGRHPKK